MRWSDVGFVLFADLLIFLCHIRRGFTWDAGLLLCPCNEFVLSGRRRSRPSEVPTFENGTFLSQVSAFQKQERRVCGLGWFSLDFRIMWQWVQDSGSVRWSEILVQRELGWSSVKIWKYIWVVSSNNISSTYLSSVFGLNFHQAKDPNRTWDSSKLRV